MILSSIYEYFSGYLYKPSETSLDSTCSDLLTYSVCLQQMVGDYFMFSLQCCSSHESRKLHYKDERKVTVKAVIVKKKEKKKKKITDCGSEKKSVQ